MTESDYRQAALKLARGSYQRALIYGTESWSGSTLRGKAREYGARYAKSRRALIERLMDNDLAFLVKEANGKIELHFGEPKHWYRKTQCAAGLAWIIPSSDTLPPLTQLAMVMDEEEEQAQQELLLAANAA